MLENGDIISIPSVVDSVYVQGASRFPGAYPYYPGFRVRDYAGLAGADERASGLKGYRIRHARTGEIEEGPDIPVEPGDTVEIKIAKRLIWRDYVQAAATVLNGILAAVALREALRN